MLARRQRDHARDAHEERNRTIAPDTVRRILCDDIRECEGRFVPRFCFRRGHVAPGGLEAGFVFCGLGIVARPIIRRRRIADDMLEDFDAHQALRQFVRLDDRGFDDRRLGRNPGAARLDRIRSERRTIDSDFVEPPVEARGCRTAHGRADPHFIVIGPGAEFRRAAHVPFPRHRRAVEVAAHTLRLAEFVAQRDVMPPLAGEKAGRRSPAMPELRAVRGRVALVAKNETEVSHAIGFAQAHAPILIVRRLARPAGAAFANDVGILPVAERIALHPRLDRDDFAAFEGKLTVAVGDAETRAGLMQNEGMIAGNELRIRRRTRPLADLGAALEQRLRHLGIRTPMPDRFVLRNEIVVSAGKGGRAQRNQGQKTEKRVHGRKFVGRVYPGHALK